MSALDPSTVQKAGFKPLIKVRIERPHILDAAPHYIISDVQM
jgi:hypothetical protein